jgi:hypothetical protein
MQAFPVHPISAPPGDAREVFARLERKFVLPTARVGFALAWLRQRCAPDAKYPISHIHSVYFDTAELDAFEDCLNGEYRKHKARLRWYGTEEQADITGDETVPAYLEVKSKAGAHTHKVRIPLQFRGRDLTDKRIAETLSSLDLEGALLQTGFRFTSALHPVVRIRYLRHRFQEAAQGAATVSLDSSIESRLLDRRLGGGRGWLPVEVAVLEIKGPSIDLPPLLSEVGRAALNWRSFSKYAICLQCQLGRAGAYGWLKPT